MPRVLVTNDDGIAATGLHQLSQALVQEGLDVLVVAPDGNRSAMGHRVTVRDSIRLEAQGGSGIWWSCSGTPADCVRMAYFEPTFPPFDVVVSGINHGVNLGQDILYSGTVAAAVEGALLGLPAVAASQQAGHTTNAGFLSEKPDEFPYARYVARVARSLAQHGLSRPLVLNINFPVEALSNEVKVARLGRRVWHRSAVESVAEGLTIVVKRPWAADPPPVHEAGTDFHELVRGHATITPLSVASGIADVVGEWTSRPEAIPLDLR
jgi:5'-nucleotidase